MQVDEADKKLNDKQAELSILMSYKDKEYPVKALKITDLQKEIAQLDTYQQVNIWKHSTRINNSLENVLWKARIFAFMRNSFIWFFSTGRAIWVEKNCRYWNWQIKTGATPEQKQCNSEGHRGKTKAKDAVKSYIDP